MPVKRRVATLLALVLSCVAMEGQQPPAETAKYDRIELTYEFLRAIYPELAGVDGRLTFQVNLYNRGTWGDSLFVHMQQCSNSTLDSAIIRTKPPFPPLPPPLPKCGAPLRGVEGDFLTASVQPYYSERLVYQFGAGGELPMGKLKSLEDEIRKHPEWNQEQMTEALNRANPGLGPEHRGDFMRSIPVDTIYRLTRCRLEPDTARMWIARLGSSPGPPEIHVEWMVDGKRSIKSESGMPCTAFFEPFKGRLIRLW